MHFCQTRESFFYCPTIKSGHWPSLSTSRIQLCRICVSIISRMYEAHNAINALSILARKYSYVCKFFTIQFSLLVWASIDFAQVSLQPLLMRKRSSFLKYSLGDTFCKLNHFRCFSLKFLIHPQYPSQLHKTYRVDLCQAQYSHMNL